MNLCRGYLDLLLPPHHNDRDGDYCNDGDRDATVKQGWGGKSGMRLYLRVRGYRIPEGGLFITSPVCRIFGRTPLLPRGLHSCCSRLLVALELGMEASAGSDMM